MHDPKVLMTTHSSPTLCVFTPTYNRAYILPKLYESLAAQTSTDFYWSIVDDGSTDNTQELVLSWISEGKVTIDYVKKENGGKPRAINDAVERCQSPLFFVVDSDDHLVPQAIEHIISKWALVDDPAIAGIVALRGRDENTPMDTWMPGDNLDLKLWDLFEIHRFRGDTSLIHRTEILKQFPFEVAENEIFTPEASVYFALDEKYDMRTDNTILTICNYLSDGLTQNFFANVKRNPIGYWKFKRYCAIRSHRLINQFRETTLYIIGCKLAHQGDIIQMAPNKLIATICYLPAIAFRYTLFR